MRKLEFERSLGLFKSKQRKNLHWGSCNSSFLRQQYTKRHPIIRLMFRLVPWMFFGIICPLLWWYLIAYLNTVAYPLGAVWFYCWFIPLSAGSAGVDYLRKRMDS